MKLYLEQEENIKIFKLLIADVEKKNTDNRYIGKKHTGDRLNQNRHNDNEVNQNRQNDDMFDKNSKSVDGKVYSKI